MTKNISRRSLAKGAAWATPVMIATSSIPAYAASAHGTYQFSASWHTSYAIALSADCGFMGDSRAGYMTQFDFYTDISYDGAAPGFGILETYGSPATGVTLNGLQMQVAYPVGYIKSIDVVSGSYTVSGPEKMSIPGAELNEYDVFTFTFIGTRRGTTSPAEVTSSWEGSLLTTKVHFETALCVPQTLGVYYVRHLGSYTTDNGYSQNFSDLGWQATRYE